MDDLAHAKLLLSLHRPQEAEKILLRRLALDPRDPDASLHLAIARLALGGEEQFYGSIEELAKTLAEWGREAEAGTLRAMALLHLKKLKSAIAEAEHALSQDPGSTLPLLVCCSAQLQLKDSRGAEATARRALEIDPTDTEAIGFLAVALDEQGRMSEAEDQITRWLSIAPDDVEAHFALGFHKLSINQPKEATSPLLEALRLDPGHELARLSLLETHYCRSPIYRALLRYSFFIKRLNLIAALAVLLSFPLFSFVLRHLIEDFPKYFQIIIILGYIFIVQLTMTAPGVARLSALCDRVIRHSLTRAERLDGLVIGSTVAILYPLFFTTICLANVTRHPLPILLTAVTLALLFSTIPASQIFTNPSRLGRWVFGGCAIASFHLMMVSFLLLPLVGQAASVLLAAATIIAGASSWLTHIPALYRPKNPGISLASPPPLSQHFR